MRSQAFLTVKSLNWFYTHNAIDTVASKTSIRLTPSILLYGGKSSDSGHLLQSAQYLHRELPIRIAQQVIGFRNLPFIIGSNPKILNVHELYIRAFYDTFEFPNITDFEKEKRYSIILQQLLDDFRDVVTLLAEGFKECRKHLKDKEDMIQLFLDQTLTSRLGMRILAEHHLSLHNEKANFVGNINISMRPKQLIEKWCQYIQNLSEHNYGICPPFKLNGHLDASFPFIETPLDYMIPELLKNAVRATIENHKNSTTLPPIIITIAQNEVDFIIRISDRGGGIPHNLIDNVFLYQFSTANSENESCDPDPFVFDRIISGPKSSLIKMHGYGFGLSTSKAYAEYLGGSLKIKTMQGIGTDVYLRLKRIDGKAESFRI